MCFLEGIVGSVWVERLADRQRTATTVEYLEDIASSPDRNRDFMVDIANFFDALRIPV